MDVDGVFQLVHEVKSRYGIAVDEPFDVRRRALKKAWYERVTGAAWAGDAASWNAAVKEWLGTAAAGVYGDAFFHGLHGDAERYWYERVTGGTWPGDAASRDRAHARWRALVDEGIA